MPYLWMIGLVMRLSFVWRQPLKIIHKYSAKKMSSPLDVIFDTCASASSSHCFNVGEAEHIYCKCTLLQGQLYFQQKTHVLQFGRALAHNFLNLFLMSDLCKFSIIIIISLFPKIIILAPNLVNSCKGPYPLRQSWLIFPQGLAFIYVRVNSPPMKIIFLLPDTWTTGYFEPNFISWVRRDAWMSHVQIGDFKITNFGGGLPGK